MKLSKVGLMITRFLWLKILCLSDFARLVLKCVKYFVLRMGQNCRYANVHLQWQLDTIIERLMRRRKRCISELDLYACISKCSTTILLIHSTICQPQQSFMPHEVRNVSFSCLNE